MSDREFKNHSTVLSKFRDPSYERSFVGGFRKKQEHVLESHVPDSLDAGRISSRMPPVIFTISHFTQRNNRRMSDLYAGGLDLSHGGNDSVSACDGQPTDLSLLFIPRAQIKPRPNHTKSHFRRPRDATRVLAAHGYSDRSRSQPSAAARLQRMAASPQKHPEKSKPEMCR
jgi:hypothetical protein